MRLNKRVETTIDRDESEGLVDEESEKSCYMFRKTSSPQHTQQRLTRAVPRMALVALILCGLLASTVVGAPPTRQEEVGTRWEQGMPIDLEQTMHVFQPQEDGGLQTVTAKDPANSQQIVLIQAHLKEEAAKFRQGDFSDPAKIHGEDMPGLAALRAGAGHIDVQYTPLPNGGQIQYTAKNPAFIAALHQWFAAQLSDHGHHAVGGHH